jgi:hypothetical protein
VEINRPKNTFRHKGYNNHEIKYVLAPEQGFKQKENPVGLAAIQYQQAVSNRISRLLSKYYIKTITYY